MKKIVIATGGTGGHIYPAIAIADKIKERYSDAEILFVGTERGLEKKLVPENGYPIEFITVEGFNRKNLLKNIEVVKKLHQGNKQAKKLMKDFQPDVVIGTGGYVCGPVVRAAHKAGIKCYTHEQNAFPGMTNKILENHVDKVFLGFQEAAEYFKKPEKHVFAGNPVRKAFLDADMKTSREKLGFAEDDFVLLVFGGSQGAEKINEVGFDLMEAVNGHEGMTYVFGTGSQYYDEILEKAKEKNIEIQPNIMVKSYINDIQYYLGAADLIISRAGALSVAESTVCGRALLLIPSPNVTGNHQYYNAKALEDNGAAVIIEEKDLTGEKLIETVASLIDDKEKLQSMSDAALKMAVTDSNERIYKVIMNLLKK